MRNKSILPIPRQSISSSISQHLIEAKKVDQEKGNDSNRKKDKLANMKMMEKKERG